MSANNASPLVKALEDAWAEYQRRYPEIPDVVVVLGTGVWRGVLDHWGKWSPQSWFVSGELTGEFMLAGEAARQGVEKVLEVLIHEAAHALCEARGIGDTSRQGRYHNQAFADAAIELGLGVEKDDVYGWAQTSYTLKEKDREISRTIEEALKLDKSFEVEEQEEEEDRVPTTQVTECSCPRRIRLRTITIEEGPVVCGVCSGEFLPIAA